MARPLPIDKVLLAAQWTQSGQPPKDICRSLGIARSTLTSWGKTETFREEVERLEKFSQPVDGDGLDIESRRNMLECSALMRPYRQRLSGSVAIQSEIALEALELLAEALEELKGSDGSAQEKAKEATKLAYLLQSAGQANKVACESLEKMWGLNTVVEKLLENE